MKNWSHKELVDICCKFAKNQFKCPVVFGELVANTANGESPDVFAVGASTYTFLFEIKVSRADFLQDKKKVFRKNEHLGMGIYRYYVAPAGLIKISDLPEKWGLIECNEKGKLKVVHGKTAANANYPVEFQNERHLSSELSMLYSSLRRIAKSNDIEELMK